jgi:hypothetical protein
MFGAVANNISDAFVTIFPIILVLRLNLPRPHMIITLCLLGFGFIASIASILRTYFLWKALYRTYDLSWMIYPLYTACAIEINLGIVRLLYLYLEDISLMTAVDLRFYSNLPSNL